MPQILFQQNDGVVVTADASVGDNLMEVARDNNVEGILAECGGACACATCHVIPDTAWADKLPPPSESEGFILEGAINVEANSRLSCQLTVSDIMDGMTVRVPEGLY